MKEARIIFPIGYLQSQSAAITSIQEAFGGVTVYTGAGIWQAPNGKVESEHLTIADIAYEPSDANDRKLFDIAWAFGHAAQQVEVYLRYGNGNVQMVQELSCMNNGEFDWNTLIDSVHRPHDDMSDVVEHAEHVELSDNLEIAKYLR